MGVVFVFAALVVVVVSSYSFVSCICAFSPFNLVSYSAYSLCEDYYTRVVHQSIVPHHSPSSVSAGFVSSSALLYSSVSFSLMLTLNPLFHH